MRVLSRAASSLHLPRGEAILVACVALLIGVAIGLFAIYGSNLSGPAVGRSSLATPVSRASFADQSLQKGSTNISHKEKQ